MKYCCDVFRQMEQEGLVYRNPAVLNGEWLTKLAYKPTMVLTTISVKYCPNCGKKLGEVRFSNGGGVIAFASHDEPD
jgi:hypothetical protein